MRKRSGVALSIAIYVGMIGIAFKILSKFAWVLIAIGIIVAIVLVMSFVQERNSPQMPTNAQKTWNFKQQAIEQASIKTISSKLTKSKSKITLFNTLVPIAIAVVLFVLAITKIKVEVIMLITAVLLIVAAIFRHTIISRLATAISITPDLQTANEFERFAEAWKTLFQSQWVYLITYEQPELYPKINAGRSVVLGRKKARYKVKLPKYIKGDNKHFTVCVNGHTLTFFPGLTIVDCGSCVYAIQNCDIETNQWTEEHPGIDFASSDATVSRHTWKYANKNGNPDRRYKNNYSIPVYKFGFVEIEATDLFSFRFMCSNCMKINGFSNL